MDILMIILLLGPSLAKIFLPSHQDVPEGLIFIFSNTVCLAVWAFVSLGLDKILSHWVAMLISWAGLIAMQGFFFVKALR